MILVTGAAGFIGRNVVAKLVEDHDVKGMVYDPDDMDVVEELGGEPVRGDITDPATLAGKLDDVDVVVHLVGIIQGSQDDFRKIHVDGTQHLLDEADDLDQFIYISALGAENASTPYFETKIKAEERVKGSGHPYTIFRPSVVFGEDDSFVNLLIDQIEDAPVAPVLGSGDYRLQPLYVKDLAAIIDQAIGNKDALNDTFEVGGPGIVSLEHLIDIILEKKGWDRRKVHIPMVLARLGAPWARRVMDVPLSKTTLTMLKEENYVKEHHYTDIFDVKLHSIEDLFTKIYGD
ncbi:MAG: NAD-dependent epimerase/dehydratase family protein [Candidatus Nanohaloarchaea archaeon]|nr:NAD-dependent epimerase/dehydratase family protein [Candidatus Nanohaloarchaea archaeon]